MDYTRTDEIRFRKEFDKVRDSPGDSRDDVPCRPLRPLLSDLDYRELQTYLRFRSRFYGGSYELSESPGYNWVLQMDLLSDDRDPPRVLGLLTECIRRAGTDGHPLYGDDVRTHIFAYAVRHGLKPPRIATNDENCRRMLVSDMLLPVIECFPDEVMPIFGNVRYVAKEGSALDKANRLFNASLPAIDARLRETTGAGIMGIYGRGMCIRTVFPSDDFPDISSGEGAMRFIDVDADIIDFLSAVYGYCRWKTGDIEDRPKSHFLDGISDVVDLVHCGGLEVPRSPSNDGPGMEFIPEELAADLPIMWESKYVHSLSSKFKENLFRYKDVESTGRCRYVPSRHITPEFKTMEPSELSYYLYWRQCAREGRFIETDEGYVWLYLCELINDESDPRRVLDIIQGLVRAYGPFNTRYMTRDRDSVYRGTGYWAEVPFDLGRVYADYCFVNDLNPPDPTLYPCLFAACKMMWALSNGMRVKTCPENFMILSQARWDRVSDRILFERFGRDCSEVLADLILVASSRPGWHRKYDVGRGTMRLDVYRDLRYYGYPNGRRLALEREVPAYYYDDFAKDLRNLMKAVVRAMDHISSKSGTLLGIDLKTDVRDAIDRHKGRKMHAYRRAYAEDITIDASEVDRAESDLKQVTSMMTTDAEEELVKAADAPAPASGDPWELFAAGLDDAQVPYLEDALAGTAVPDTVMEDSINGIAMDTVGDTVVEGGTPVQEYVEELNSVVGRIRGQSIPDSRCRCGHVPKRRKSDEVFTYR